MTQGRPTKYTDEIQEKADQYVEYAYMEMGDIVPSQEGLAEYLELALSTCKLWATDGEHPLFSATFERLKSKQARLLINGGLSSDMNSTIAKLMLHNHGYSDRTENKNDHISSDGSMTPTRITRVIVDPDDSDRPED